MCDRFGADMAISAEVDDVIVFSYCRFGIWWLETAAT
jgi:hypothetical protein